MGSRTWIKIYCDKWLNGTIRDETPELRGIWIDLLVLAGSGKYGDEGEIKITDHVGFLDQQLADLLQISLQKWVACKKKLVQTDRVCIENRNIVAIKNWSKYQSEYHRQKPYREGATQIQDTIDNDPENSNQRLQHQVTEDAVTKGTTRDRDKRLEKEIRERDYKEETKQEESSVRFLKSKEEVITLYQENVLLGATISEDMEAELKTACGRYSPDWVYDAIREAIAQNHPDWRYIVGVLRNWSKYGKKKG